MTRREALAGAARRLDGASETPRLDAELLLAAALGIERQALLLSDLEGEAPAGFEALVARREKSEPVAYIVGRRGFWTIELEVAPGVLVPRPDSETLIEAAVAHFGPLGSGDSGGPRTILDLGTGSGALLLAALDQWPGAHGVGIDRCERALAIARANGERLGLARRAQFRLGDWAEGIEQSFDLVLCNPPYVEADADLPRDVVEWEPHAALFAGADGLDNYRRIAPQISGLLGEGGIACIEIGLGQAAAVTALFVANRLCVEQRQDLGGRTRCLVLRG